jgi:sec-independent protein translocase protein TatC
MGFATDTLEPLFSLGQYISFVIFLLLPFGFVFQLPLVILVLAKFGIVTVDYLIAKRKIVIVLSFVVGLLISPTPDVFSQTMIAIPMIILYEASIFVLKHIKLTEK